VRPITRPTGSVKEPYVNVGPAMYIERANDTPPPVNLYKPPTGTPLTTVASPPHTTVEFWNTRLDKQFGDDATCTGSVLYDVMVCAGAYATMPHTSPVASVESGVM